jgi:hypothetical protein
VKVISVVLVVFTSTLSHFVEAQTATDLNCTQCVGSGDLANDSIGSAKIKDGSLASGDLAPSAVKTTNLNNGSVTFNKLATGVRDSLDAAIAVLTTQTVGTTGILTAFASCPAEKLIVSASCGCDTNGGTSNDGVLNECWTEANTAFATCYDHFLGFNAALDFPRAVVKAVCLGAISADGTPWLPTSTGLAQFKSDNDVGTQHQEWLANMQVEYQSKVDELAATKARLESSRSR